MLTGEKRKRFIRSKWVTSWFKPVYKQISCNTRVVNTTFQVAIKSENCENVSVTLEDFEIPFRYDAILKIRRICIQETLDEVN